MGTDTASNDGIRRLPGEENFSAETKEVMALLRSEKPVPEEDDPNGWFHQIRDHLKQTPAERMKRWAGFATALSAIRTSVAGDPMSRSTRYGCSGR